MIDALRVTKTANFHELKRQLSNAAVDDLFRQIRANLPSASQNLFFHRRIQTGGALWSAISFFYERSPAFISEDAGVRERICGFMLLVEHRGHIAIFRSKLDLPAGFNSRYLGRVSTDRVELAVARNDAIFEKIRLRNMSVSKHAMRNKTFEADDLQNVVGPAGANRYVPQGYSVRSGSSHFSTTPSTGRIAQRSDRGNHFALVEYARTVIDELIDATGAPAKFINTFARAIDLATLEGTANPITFAVDVTRLGDMIYERRELRLVRQQAGQYKSLSKVQIDAVLSELDAALTVTGTGKVYDLHNFPGGPKIGTLSFNQSRVALRELRLPLSAGIEVENTGHLLGQDPNRIALRKYIDQEDGFIILFDILALAYIDGTLFRDDGLTDGGDGFLRYLRADPLLATVTDEKGTFTARQRTFDAHSTFGVVAASVADGDEVLVCDDLGNEWADFIGLSNGSSPPRITFYHAKHGDLSLGAGPFHISVSQAIKNLQWMNLPAEAIGVKIRGWRNNYRNGGVRTRIPRVLRGNPVDLATEFSRARNAPDAIRRVCIVTSSLSRAAVEKALGDIAAGNAPHPHFVQLYWLLLSFFSACTEMNAHGYVICRA